MFVTNEEQLTSLVSLIEEGSLSLEGLLVLVDGNLVVGKFPTKKTVVLLSHIASQNRKSGLNLIIVSNPETKLDKRLQLQLTHTTKMVSRQVKQKEERL